MRNVAFAAVVVVGLTWLAPPSRAQSACDAYFTTYVYLPLPGASLQPGMTGRQEKWFKKNAKKKYPNLCADADKATYILVTSSHVNEVPETVTVTRRAYTTGPVTEPVGVTASGPGLPPSQPIWGTRMETFVTTWQEKETRTTLSLHTEVFLLQAKKPLKQAISADDYDQPFRAGFADGPDADRKAFENALWFLNVVAKAGKKTDSAQ